MSVVISDVSKSYGNKTVFRKVSLSIDAGSSLCIQGFNGSGKTTLLKIIALIATPDSGSVLVNGVDMIKESQMGREKIRSELIGYSFQEPLLVPYLTAVENLLVAKLPNLSNRDMSEAIRTLSSLGLSNRTNNVPSQLSVGEKKRVDLARAVIRKTKILILDEPLSNLDPESTALVVRLLGDFKEKGGLVISSASHPAQASWADHVMTLQGALS